MQSWRGEGKECLVADDGSGASGHKTHLHCGFFLFYYKDKKQVSRRGFFRSSSLGKSAVSTFLTSELLLHARDESSFLQGQLVNVMGRI